MVYQCPGTLISTHSSVQSSAASQFPRGKAAVSGHRSLGERHANLKKHCPDQPERQRSASLLFGYPRSERVRRADRHVGNIRLGHELLLVDLNVISAFQYEEAFLFPAVDCGGGPPPVGQSLPIGAYLRRILAVARKR